MFRECVEDLVEEGEGAAYGAFYVAEKNGGDDGTRTRGLCRDRVAGRRNLLELNGTDSPFLVL